MALDALKMIHICPQRVIFSDKAKILLLAIGKLKRSLLNQSTQQTFGTICPACGNSPLLNGTKSTPTLIKSRKTLGRQIDSLLAWKRSWRWVAALYERS